jgi:hypothetical protein
VKPELTAFDPVPGMATPSHEKEFPASSPASKHRTVQFVHFFFRTANITTHSEMEYLSETYDPLQAIHPVGFAW